MKTQQEIKNRISTLKYSLFNNVFLWEETKITIEKEIKALEWVLQ